MTGGPRQVVIDGVAGVWLDETTAASLVGITGRLERVLLERYGMGLTVEPGVLAFLELMKTLEVFRECSADGTPERSMDPVAGLSLRDLVDVAEAAELLGCSPRNVRALARRGSLPPVRRSPLLFDRVDVENRAHQRAS